MEKGGTDSNEPDDNDAPDNDDPDNGGPDDDDRAADDGTTRDSAARHRNDSNGDNGDLRPRAAVALALPVTVRVSRRRCTPRRASR